MSTIEGAAEQARAIAAALRTWRFRWAGETELQVGIAQALARAGLTGEREVALDERDRIDFLVGAVGIETKVKGSFADTLRQLGRYAEHPAIGALVLVTDRMQHATMPTMIAGKPVEVVLLVGGLR